MLERVQAEDPQGKSSRDDGSRHLLWLEIGIPVRACIFATSTVAERLGGPAKTGKLCPNRGISADVSPPVVHFRVGLPRTARPLLAGRDLTGCPIELEVQRSGSPFQRPKSSEVQGSAAPISGRISNASPPTKGGQHQAPLKPFGGHCRDLAAHRSALHCTPHHT